MDNFNHDNLVAGETADIVQKLASTVGNLAKGTRDKAKKASAQKAADAGQYWTLRPYLKNLIPIPPYIIDQVKDQGITEYAVIQLPEQGAGASQGTIIAQLKKLTNDPIIPGTDAQVAGLRQSYIVSLNAPGVGDTRMPVGGAAVATDANASGYNFKKFLPWILGFAALALVVWFASKKMG